MVIMFPILMGIALAGEDAHDTIQRDFNFIVNSALAGIAVVSMIVTYPLGVQHVQEMVPWAYSSHEDILNAGDPVVLLKRTEEQGPHELKHATSSCAADTWAN